MSKIIDIHSRTTIETESNVIEEQIQIIPEIKEKTSSFTRLKKFIGRTQSTLFKNIIKPPLMAYRRYRTPALLGELSKQCQKLNDEKHFSILMQTHGGTNTIYLKVYPFGFENKNYDDDSIIYILQGKLPGYSECGKMRLKDLRLAKKTLREVERSFRTLHRNRHNIDRDYSIMGESSL